MFEEELEEFGGAGQPPERHRPDFIHARVGHRRFEDVGDPGDDGVDIDRVACLHAGDDRA